MNTAVIFPLHEDSIDSIDDKDKEKDFQEKIASIDIKRKRFWWIFSLLLL